MERGNTCCFTGHRPARLPWGNKEADEGCVALKSRLYLAVEEAHRQGMTHFICGMALGSDHYFCEAVLAARARHPGVTLEAAIPCTTQCDSWRDEEKERYRRLLAQCDFETLVQRSYDAGCMHRRNRYMVEHSALLLAVYDGYPGGGTLSTITYAMNRGVTVNVIDPTSPDG